MSTLEQLQQIMMDNLCDDDFIQAGAERTDKSSIRQFVRQYALNCLFEDAVSLTDQEIDEFVAMVRAGLGVQGYRHFPERRRFERRSGEGYINRLQFKW